MKKGLGVLLLSILLISLLLSLSSVSAIDKIDDMGLTSKSLELHLNISTKLTIVPQSEDSLIREVGYQLNYMPLDTWQQTVKAKKIEPAAIEANNSLFFRWDNPKTADLGFDISSEISVKNDLIKIRGKIPFPLTNLPPEVVQYTLPSQNINSDNPAIAALASELASGNNDLNLVAFSLFGWVADNIEYRKTPQTELIAQSATWVLVNRYGVCDEIATLFIALARSLGIPARYAAGLAYSNLPEIADWQPHGWAELYFPGYGWVPFDPTYREFGFVDPTHIVLRQSPDSNDSTSLLRWVGRDVELEKSSLALDASLQGRSGSATDLVSLELEPLQPNLGFGSYGLVKATVRNPNSFYVYTDIILSKIQGLKISGGEKRAVLLRPLESREVFWLVQIDGRLDRNYLYTFPLSALTSRNTTSSAALSVERNSPIYSEMDMSALLDELDKEEPLTYSNNLAIGCSPQESTIYIFENLSLSCELRNLGNNFLKGLVVCLEKDCRTLELPISHSIQQNFTFSPKKLGSFENLISARSQVISKRVDFAYTVLDAPNLTIEELNHPTQVGFGEGYNLTLRLRKNSASEPSAVNLIVQTPRKGQKFEFGTLNSDKAIIINIGANGLREGQNNIRLILSYQDKNNKTYITTSSLAITQQTDSILQRILLVIYDFVSWLETIIGKI
jgi:transglutaminase-like putative cysteine protease